MAIESKHHRPPPVDHVLVSQATRRDAQDPSKRNVRSRARELEELTLQKRKIEVDLAGYSKAAFAKAQAQIRREHRGNERKSIAAWFDRKAEMESERQRLIREKHEIEKEMIRLKPLVQAEKQREALERKPASGKPKGDTLEDFALFRADGTLIWDGVAAQLLLELRKCRVLLERIAGDGDA